MFGEPTLLVAAILATGVLFGGMVFFAAIFAPLVFQHLPKETAAGFIRAVFPRYYLGGALVALPAAGFILPLSRLDGAAMLAVAAGFLLLRQGFLPAINLLRDRAHAGDVAAERGFKRMHRLSVLVNLVQMVIAGAVLGRLALI